MRIFSVTYFKILGIVIITITSKFIAFSKSFWRFPKKIMKMFKIHQVLSIVFCIPMLPAELYMKAPVAG